MGERYYDAYGNIWEVIAEHEDTVVLRDMTTRELEEVDLTALRQEFKRMSRTNYDW